MPEAWTYAQLVALVEELSERNAAQDRVIVAQGERIAELERWLAADSSMSSRPPSSDAPWDKQPAKKRLSRSRSGRTPGKQPRSASASRSLVEDPNETFEVAPDRCAWWPKVLAPLLGYLRGLGVDPQPEAAVSATPAEDLWSGIAATCWSNVVWGQGGSRGYVDLVRPFIAGRVKANV